jgi:uncharacterized protein YndB with AHSA1/START domain
VYTAGFDVSWFPGESVITLSLTRQGDKTLLLCTVLRESREQRDGFARMPIEGGIVEAFDRLDDLLARSK